MIRPTLLCVDDDPATLQFYRVLLASHGYEVIVANDGFHALKLFNPRQVSAVILDYEMPGLRGSEVAAEMKRRYPDVPVVMVSGCQSVVEDAPRFVDAAIAKGASVSCLLDKVSALLQVARSRMPKAQSVPRAFAPLGSALAAVAMAGAVISKLWK
jgi:DNA-binding response OmpR family regulator